MIKLLQTKQSERAGRAAAKSARVQRPSIHGALGVYLLEPHEPAAAAKERYAPLHEALEAGAAVLHEPDGIRALELENLGEASLFAQAGDVVRGGWQDWTLAVDVILPCHARRRRIDLLEFCVHPGRWHFRDDCVTSAAFASPVEPVRKGIEWLLHLPAAHPLAAGCVFSVKDRIRGAHLYADAGLFQAFWPRLLEEALTEAAGVAAADDGPPLVEEVRTWLGSFERTRGTVSRLNQRTAMRVKEGRRGGGSMCIETLDRGGGGICVHRAISM